MDAAEILKCLLDEFSREIQNFADAINRAISFVPDFLAGLLDPVFQKWREFCDRVREFFTLASDMFSAGCGDAEALRDASVAWRDSVAPLLDEAYEALSHDAIKADRSWHGPAGDKYAAGFQDQIDAIRSSKDVALEAADVLEDHAQALDLFNGNIQAGLIGTIASIAGLGVSAVALIPPLTPLGIIGLIVSIIALVISLYYLFKNENDDLERMAELGRLAIEKAGERACQDWPVLVIR